MLAAPGRRDVRDLRQRSPAEILVVVVQVHDVPEEARPSDEPGHVEDRDADGLRTRVRRAAGADPPARVVVLDVELPRDAPPLEPVEDRGPGAGRAGHPRAPVGHAPARRGGEPVVEQHVFAGHVPVEGKVAAVVVPHHARLRALAPLRDGGDEAVHVAARGLGAVRGRVVRHVRPRAVPEPEGTHARPRAARRADRHARAVRDPVGARVGPEVVVEGVVLLHQDDEVPDRRGRRRGAASAGAVPARAAVVASTRSVARRTPHGRTS